jgi:hypothetical protein
MSTGRFSGNTLLVPVGNTIGLEVQYFSTLLLKAPQIKGRKNNTDTVIRFVSLSAKLDICTVVDLNGRLVEAKIRTFSNGNASETKANESFDNSVFFDIEAKRTSSLESKLFSKRSEHIR